MAGQTGTSRNEDPWKSAEEALKAAAKATPEALWETSRNPGSTELRGDD